MTNDIARPAASSRSLSYEEMLRDKSLSEKQRDALVAEMLVAYMSVLLVRRGDAATARLMLQVERWMLEWDDQGREKDLILEVDPANKSHFTNDLIEKLKGFCQEVSNRFNLDVNWVWVRETLPVVGPGWRELVQRELHGERPTNQARRLQPAPQRWLEDNLAFTNEGEQRVYRLLKHRQESVLPAEETIAIFPLPNGRIAQRTWEPDFLVTYKGRAGILEIDGPHHNARRALDVTREHLMRDSGIAYVDRVPVETLESRVELERVIDRFLRRLAEAR
ncbi:hypothetical protein [Streptomyces lomondensis]|uniref:DUF559 domain-containing protein n=1 Tax=Streptomyces lomondensis TaxID=68229 RepID=A0ABQ2XPZ2_9ACTN|nr:hypothetical protein [Streptomyces lomondensis]MCF0082185.1 hypothetical protein [Streptomyces lomondensis]GGX27973.1 hypothetical protein GCM10010383_68350 [Streptomyces lomondensis]